MIEVAENQQDRWIETFMLLRLRYEEACRNAEERGVEDPGADPMVKFRTNQLKLAYDSIGLSFTEIEERHEYLQAKWRERSREGPGEQDTS